MTKTEKWLYSVGAGNVIMGALLHSGFEIALGFACFIWAILFGDVE